MKRDTERQELIKGYQDDQQLRLSFCGLSRKTFGLDFEDWYRGGYWTDRYIPYSIITDGQVIANVSVNRMDFIWDGKIRHFIQLGTVMTDEGYRNRGLIRRLMDEIRKDYSDKAEGVYLFANDSVLDFYPRFGFRKAVEYRYGKTVSIIGEGRMKRLPMNNRQDWSRLERAIENSYPCGRFEMADNSGLIMFYVTKFMRENVYYDEKTDVYVIAEQEGKRLLIHQVISPMPAALDEVIEAFGREISLVELGFTPRDREGYMVAKVEEEDTTLFLMGGGFSEFEAERLMFPTLSHA